MTTLLGYLARFASFSSQSEVLCTEGLAYLLRTHADARSALADEVQIRAGTAIGKSVTWLGQAPQPDGGIPDLEARTADGIPVVKIEAKLGAELGLGQLESYAADLRGRNNGNSALLVLVPKAQIAKFARATADSLNLSGSGPWRVTDGHRIGIAVISWDELFAVLHSGATDRFLYELEQLQAMYYELSSDFIAPLASDEDLSQWKSSDTNFVKLVDQVTRRLTNQHRVYPMQTESIEQGLPEGGSGEYRFRYVCPCASKATSCFSIGARDSFAEWLTPIWMRFHKDTGNFRLIRQCIESSDLRSLESSGHVWIPLDVPRDVSGEAMIDKLVGQAEKIMQVAYQSE
jgi:hypothetical protein